MFAVPGWSVSADTLKIQTLRPIQVTKSTEQTSKTSKKRKRGPENVDGIAITAHNLADLWKKHIDGKSASKPKAGSKTLIESTGVETGGRKITEADVKQMEKKRKRKNKEAAGEIESRGVEGSNGHVKTNGKEAYQKRKTLHEEKRLEKALAQANGRLPPTRPTTTQLEGSKKAQHPAVVPSESVHSQNSLGSDLVPPPQYSKLTPLQSSMRQKLVSARFRYLNQTLYTTPSDASYDLFRHNPTFFTEYHEGFQRQVEAWPENPVEGFIRWIQQRGSKNLRQNGLDSQKASFKKKNKTHETTPLKPNLLPESASNDSTGPPLPRHPATNVCTVADLGCGTAHFARTLSPSSKSLKLHIHSFDLCAPNSFVTIADIRALPLKDASVDVTIFCLALMGTNWVDFVEEAWRILRWKGECWIGEVGSRFVTPKGIETGRVGHSVGNRTKKTVGQKSRKQAEGGNEEEDFPADEAALEGQPGSLNPSLGSAHNTTNLAPFISVLRTRGFVLMGEPELGNKMFVRMRFTKSLTPTRGKCTTEMPKETQGTKGTKFIDRERFSNKEIATEDEPRVLKACVYKNR